MKTKKYAVSGEGSACLEKHTDIKKASPKAPKNHKTKCSKIPTKKELTLIALLDRGSAGLIQPEAYDLHGESCLHTSISELYNDHGIHIDRKTVPYAHRNGGTTHFTRYFLTDPEAIKKAKALLAYYQKKRGAYASESNEEAA